MGRIIDYGKLLPTQQRQLIDQLASSAMRRIDAEKPLSDFIDEVWRNLKLSQTALKNAKSNYERDLITELCCTTDSRRRAWLELRLMEERDRQRSYNAQ